MQESMKNELLLLATTKTNILFCLGEEAMLLERAVRLLLKRATLASGVLPTTPGPIFPDPVPVPK